MSKTIDERVVEMKFDNRHFEQNVQTTMSTLDKLKLKLNLKGAAKGLDELSASSNKVNMNGLSNALTSVTAKFSALDVIGVTALTRITNAAITAGNRIVKALTIEPITTGLKEYETQINAVQTILANTQSKGTTIDDVNAALRELNSYADKTIYNFTEMTRNIGTFTAAGVDLETSVTAIQGIANLAAVSGSTSQQASTAMYQLSQALAAGSVKLMDWNSVVNAGMGGQVFQDALKETARVHGVAIDDMIEKEGSFRETLRHGWITSEILTETLSKFTMATEGLTEAEIEANKEKLRSIGYTEEQIEGIFKLGNTATNAATKVKTFTQLWDVLKEAAQSGWAQTWQIIVGDFEEAKALFSPLAEFLTGVINAISEARNKFLDGAFGKSFKGLFDNVALKKTAETIETVTKSLDYYQTMVNKIWRGDYKNQPYRSGLLEKEGHNYKVLQSLVNKGYQYKLTMDDVVEAEKKYGKTVTTTAEATEEASKITTDYILELLKLSDAELKALGYEEDQIAAFRELERVAKRAGIPLREFIENIDEIDGRWLVINSFKNAGQGLVAVITAIKDAWVDIFPPATSDQLFNIIASLHKFSTHLVVGDETADKLKRTLKGLFAILDIGLTLITGPFKLAGKILIQFLQALDILPHDILGITAVIGDAIVGFRDWLDSTLDLTGVFKFLAPYIKDAAKSVSNWFKGLGKSEALLKFTKFLKSSKEAIVEWFKGLKETDNIAKYIFEGLVNGLSTGFKGVINFVVNLAGQIITAVKNVLGIHSPSTEFFEIGKNIIKGLFNGISSMVQMLYTLLMSIGGKLVEIVKGLDIGSIFTIAVGTGTVYGFVKIANAISKIAEPFESIDYVIKEAGDTLKAFQGVLKGVKFKLVADAMKTMATSVAILAGSIVVLTMIDQKKMWSAVGAVTVLMGILAGLTFIAGKYGGDKGLEFGKIALTLLGLGVAMALMAMALKSISKIDSGKAIQAIGGFVVIMGSMIGMMAIVNKNKSGFIKLGTAFTSIGLALVMMAIVAKTLGKMDRGQLIQGGLAIVAFSGIIVGLMAATKLLTGSKNVDNIGKSISKIATAILIMMVVAKLAAKMEPEEMSRGVGAILAFSGIIVGLMAATKLISGSKNVGKIGGAILGISTALLMMVFVAKLAAKMDPAEFGKGILAITAFGGIIVGLMAATRVLTGSKNVSKIGRTILMISAAIGLLALTAVILSLIDTAALAKGVIAVGFLSAMVMGLVYVTKFAKNVTGTIGTLIGAIAVLAISMGVLSMIKPEKLLSASVALGIVLGMFALVVKSTNSVKKSLGTLIVLTLAIGALAGAIYAVAQVPADRAIASAGALSVLLGTMAGVMTLLSKFGTNPKALLGVLGIAALCIPLFLMVEILSKMQNVQNASTNAMALASFMGVLAVVQLLCAAAGAIYTATGGVAMLGLVGMVALVGTLYLLMGALAIMSNIENAVSNLDALSAFMIKMTGVLIALSIIGPLALSGVTGMAALIGLITAIGALSVGIGYLMEKIPALQNFLNTGIDVLVGIAGGIGRMIGAFAGGILTEVTDSLPKIGTDLSNFMTNAAGFIEGASKITPGMMDGVKSLAETILILTGADILQSIGSWLTGGNSLANFGEQLNGLGTTLSTFVTELGPFGEDQLKAVDCAGKALKALATAASEIPNEGGVAGFFAGENDLGKFGSKLPLLGTQLNQFVTNLGVFGDDQVKAVDCAGKALKALASAAAEIPNEGGVAGFFAGNNDLGKFGEKLPGLGTQLNGFITSLGTFGDDQIKTVDCAGKAILALSKAAAEIPNEGGVAGFFAGENDLSKFGAKLPELANCLKQFVTNLGTFTPDQITTINSACSAIKTIAKLGEIDIHNTGDGLNTFGKNMVKFAKKIKEFVEEISKVGSEGIESAISKIKELFTTLSNIGTNSDVITKFGDSLKTIAKDGVKAFVKEFSGSTPKNDAKKALKALLGAGIDGAKDKKSDVKKEFKSIAEAAVDSLCTKALKEDAKQAGKDLVTGFANGIKNNKYLATNAGTSIGKAALKAAKEAIDSNSPSKEAMKIGNYFGQGLVIGIEDYESKTYSAGFSIADRAKEGLSRAISKVSDLIMNGVDSQPTIRPVLDLSDVENGANHLNSMFNDGPSFGVMSNINAISSGIKLKNQNGVNSDVVSAINHLRKDLGNVNGTVNNYTVNGVTYDDGSNIKDAVGAIVRAAKMERRV